MDEPLHFEDLQKGDRWVSHGRTITRELVLAFADLTGDCDPLHVDEDFARNTPFRAPIAHGLLGLSILAGLSSKCPRISTVAFTQVGDWQFKHPIFFGDIVHAEAEIVDLEPCGRRSGKVTWYRQLVNQDNRVVQQGSFETIVARSHVAKRMPSPGAVRTEQSTVQ